MNGRDQVKYIVQAKRTYEIGLEKFWESLTDTDSVTQSFGTIDDALKLAERLGRQGQRWSMYRKGGDKSTLLFESRLAGASNVLYDFRENEKGDVVPSCQFARGDMLWIPCPLYFGETSGILLLSGEYKARVCNDSSFHHELLFQCPIYHQLWKKLEEIEVSLAE